MRSLPVETNDKWGPCPSYVPLRFSVSCGLSCVLPLLDYVHTYVLHSRTALQPLLSKVSLVVSGQILAKLDADALTPFWSEPTTCYLPFMSLWLSRMDNQQCSVEFRFDGNHILHAEVREAIDTELKNVPCCVQEIICAYVGVRAPVNVRLELFGTPFSALRHEAFVEPVKSFTLRRVEIPAGRLDVNIELFRTSTVVIAIQDAHTESDRFEIQENPLQALQLNDHTFMLLNPNPTMPTTLRVLRTSGASRASLTVTCAHDNLQCYCNGITGLKYGF